jgi:hypothetical protein
VLQLPLLLGVPTALLQQLGPQPQVAPARQVAAVVATPPWMRTGGSKQLVRRPQGLLHWLLLGDLCLGVSLMQVVRLRAT